ncbi:hypothetical protein LWI28_020708 [Acer negundo]|uniref:Uncharacterized protein n=1 Tax=Acer negundo TaxID=4023 RepID=A0AAD5NR37_ACENE|nr:hypothetical protein LWI28_020708 [Acer negundo]
MVMTTSSSPSSPVEMEITSGLTMGALSARVFVVVLVIGARGMTKDSIEMKSWRNFAPSPVKSGQYCGRREEASNGVSMRHVSGHEEDVPIPNLIVEQRQASELIKAKSAVTEKSAPIELTVTDFVWQTNRLTLHA